MSRQSLVWLDGVPATSLPLPDRGLDFGDGVFETLLVNRGRLLFADLHLERLSKGLQALALPDCLNTARNQMQSAVSTLGHDWQWAALRLTVIRGAGARGYAPSGSASPRILIAITQLDRDCSQIAVPAKLCVAKLRLSTQPFLALIKHLNRLEQVLAAAQAQSENADECVLMDDANNLTCVAAGNIFLVHAGELLTPKLINCGVLGTRRRLILEHWAPSLGLNVREASLSISDLTSADEVFYSNSLQAVRPVGSLSDKKHWNNYSVCEALFQCYLEELK
jgi:4-amino-4-deoxychorismate lyase